MQSGEVEGGKVCWSTEQEYGSLLQEKLLGHHKRGASSSCGACDSVRSEQEAGPELRSRKEAFHSLRYKGTGKRGAVSQEVAKQGCHDRKMVGRGSKVCSETAAVALQSNLKARSETQASSPR